MYTRNKTGTIRSKIQKVKRDKIHPSKQKTKNIIYQAIFKHDRCEPKGLVHVLINHRSNPKKLVYYFINLLVHNLTVRYLQCHKLHLEIILLSVKRDPCYVYNCYNLHLLLSGTREPCCVYKC